MFRPNRIGTPYIYTFDETASTLDFAVAENALLATTWRAHVINAAALSDFGRTALNWRGSESLTAGNHMHLAQQFSITEPLAGDAVGIEVVGSIMMTVPDNVIIRPFFARLNEAGSTVLETETIADNPTFLGNDYQRNDGSGASTYASCSYKTQVIVRASAGVAGVYCHGFQINNIDDANFNFSAFNIVCGMRQLNDQEDIGYRDSRR